MKDKRKHYLCLHEDIVLLSIVIVAVTDVGRKLLCNKEDGVVTP